MLSVFFRSRSPDAPVRRHALPRKILRMNQNQLDNPYRTLKGCGSKKLCTILASYAQL
jgi:hypothetical protein